MAPKRGIFGRRRRNDHREARRLLAEAEATNLLLQVTPPKPDTPIERIIELLRPPWSKDGDQREQRMLRSDVYNWYAQWLVRLVYYALSDSNTRHQALEAALDLQIRIG